MPTPTPAHAPWNPRRSLRARFALALGGSGLLLAAALATVFDASQRELLQAQAREVAAHDALTVGTAFGQIINDRLALLGELAALPELAGGVPDDNLARLALEQSRSRQQELAWLAFVGVGGRIDAATNALFEGAAYEGELWWTRAQAGPAVGRVRTWPALAQRLGVATAQERRFLELASPVIDPEGRTIGAVVALVDWRWVRDRLLQLRPAEASRSGAEPLLLVASDDGQVPLVLIGPAALIDRPLPLALAWPQEGEVLSDRRIWPDGTDRFATHVGLSLSAPGSTDRWSLLLRRPADVVLAPLQALRRQLLLLTLGGSALFAALSWWLAGRIARPIEQLSRTASGRQRGDLAAFEAPDPQQPADEIRDLHVALHHMDKELRARLAEQQQAAQRYMALFDASPDAIVVATDGRIAMVNPAGVKLLAAGTGPAAPGADVLSLFAEADRPAVQGLLLAPGRGSGSGSGSGSDQRLECSLVRLDGHAMTVELSTAAFPDGSTSALQLVLRDVTARRQAAEAQARYSVMLEDKVAERTRDLQSAMDEVRAGQQHLQDLNTELEAAARRATAASDAKSAFLANMSHEVRTPMNAIIGLTRLLLEQPLPADAHRSLATVQASAQALMALLDDMLDYSKIEAGQLRFEVRPMSLHDVLRRSCDLFEARASQRGLALSLHIAPGVPDAVAGDPLRVAQVINNLLGNAIKFTEAGSVTLSAKVEPTAHTPGVASVRIAVRDTGIGIDPASQYSLFEPFTQADASITRRYGGTGLGLAICRRLVALMDGELGVHSQPGQGSEFWFRLPLVLAAVTTRGQTGMVSADAGPESLADLASQLMDLQGAEILVAEDNAINREVAQALLTRLGLRPTLVADGRQAVAAVRLDPARWALVLMDLHMPDMDGLQAAEELKRDPGVAGPPVVAMSAAVLDEDRERCRRAGMLHHVAKPVDPSALAAALLACARRVTPPAARQAAGGATVDDGRAASAAQRSPTAEPSPATGVLDRATALGRLGGNDLLLDLLLRTFAQREADAERLLRELASTGRWAQLRDRMHDLKGSAGAVGATRLAQAAESLERCLAGPPAARDSASLQQALTRVTEALDTTRLLIEATVEAQAGPVIH